MFKPGDEVVCINDDEPPQVPPNVVVRGQRYTVIFSEVRPVPVVRIGPMVMYRPIEFVFVKEVPSPKGVGHYAFRFEKAPPKAEQRQTDISVFKDMLKVKENAT